MGRWHYGTKTEADDIKKIEVSFLKKHGYFQQGRSGTITWTSGWSEKKSSVSVEVSPINEDGYLRIYYTQTDRSTEEKKDFDYKIPLTTTPCYFGGVRHWFVCCWYKNGIYCGKRVGVLYKNGDYFACRHCYNLTYNSRNQNYHYSLFPLFSLLTIENKIEKLERQIKRHSYKGRPTQKQRRLEQLYRKIDVAYQKTKFMI